MTKRYALPVLVVTCAVIVVIVAALQGPVLVGEPRIVFLFPDSGAQITPSSAAHSPAPENTDSPRPPLQNLLNPTTILLAIGALVLAGIVAIAFLVVRFIRQRRRVETTSVATSGHSGAPEDTTQREQAEAPARIARGIQRSLDALERAADPHDAVVEAWLGLQEAAEDSGLSVHPSETPSEFTRRILARDERVSRELDVLLTLYQDVRFGEHRATAADIERAREALRAITEVWS